jgi:hypothetical protein
MISECFDLTGQAFGEWTVIEQVPRPEHWNENATSAFWLCLCSCGHKSIVIANKLRSGKSKSCGCSLLNSNIPSEN